MNLEKVVFGFFTIFACTLTFGFFLGDMDRPEMHHPSDCSRRYVNALRWVKFVTAPVGSTPLATSVAPCRCWPLDDLA